MDLEEGGEKVDSDFVQTAVCQAGSTCYIAGYFEKNLQ